MRDKSWDYTDTVAIGTSIDEAWRMAYELVEWLRSHDRRVFFDAEHFFDGYKRNPDFTMRVIQAAEEAGAEVLVLCDTNGGALPHEVEHIVTDVLAARTAPIGVHFHNDGGCGVANTLAAVRLGASQV